MSLDVWLGLLLLLLIFFFFLKKKHIDPHYRKVLGSLPPLAELSLLGVHFLDPGLPGFSVWSKYGLAVKTTCGEHMAPTEVAASIGGRKTVPGFSCNGHLHA